MILKQGGKQEQVLEAHIQDPALSVMTIWFLVQVELPVCASLVSISHLDKSLFVQFVLRSFIFAKKNW